MYSMRISLYRIYVVRSLGFFFFLNIFGFLLFSKFFFGFDIGKYFVVIFVVLNESFLGFVLVDGVLVVGYVVVFVVYVVIVNGVFDGDFVVVWVVRMGGCVGEEGGGFVWYGGWEEFILFVGSLMRE